MGEKKKSSFVKGKGKNKKAREMLKREAVVFDRMPENVPFYFGVDYIHGKKKRGKKRCLEMRVDPLGEGGGDRSLKRK